MTAERRASTNGVGPCMAERVRAFDWCRTPLGPLDHWTQRLRGVVDMLLAHPMPMILLWGPDLTQIYNDGYAVVAGAKHPAALGQPNRECWPEALPLTEPIHTRVLAGEQVLLTDQLIPLDRPGRGTLEEAYFTVSYGPCRDGDGRASGIFATVIETTAKVLAEREEERLRAEAARRDASARVSQQTQLRDAEARYLELVNAIEHGFCTLEVSFDDGGRPLDYRFLEVSPSFEAQTGIPNAAGRWMREIAPDQDRHWFDLYGRVALSGEPARFEQHSTPLGRWWSVFAFRTGDPALRRVAVLFHDITDRKRAETALRASEGRLRFLDTLGEATRAAVDPFAVMAAAARLLGEHLGVNRCAYADVEADNDRFTIRDDWRAPDVSSTAGTYRLELFGVRAAADLRAGRVLVVRDVDAELDPETDGGAKTFNAIGIKAIVCCPLVKEGRLRAMMAVHSARPRDWADAEVALVREVAERSWAHIERVRAEDALRRLAADLSEAGHRKDEFLATLAHELRNPLAPIRNGLTVLRLGRSGGDHERVVGMMERQIGQMVRLVDDLLDVSRVTTGKVELRRERVTLQAVIQAAVETSGPLIEQSGHELHLHIPHDPVPVDADPTRLAQVVTNLLNNAAKYTPAGGTLELSAAAEGQEAVVRVTDSGIGIAAEMLPKVFDLFTQVGRSIDRSQGGLGIGLSLVRKLVGMHGGTVTADSAGLGKGSTFKVRLPLASDRATEARPLDTQVGKRPLASARRILVVDDNVDGAESLALLLTLGGHEAHTAHDGRVAIEAARRLRPELVFLDIGMPGMNGYEVAKAFRSDADLSGVVLVALTGWGASGDRERVAEAGFDYHLTKPADVARVEAVLTEMAEKLR